MNKLWLEVALNGGRGRNWQPTMPLSVEDIVSEGLACVSEGAAIVHYHAYDAATGRQQERNLDLHRRIIEGIRSRCDAIVYPTTAMRILGQPAMGSDRFSVEEILIREGLLEWFVLDPGSMVMAHRSDLSGGYVYLNEIGEIIAGYEFAKQHGLSLALAIYEFGFARLARRVASRVGDRDPGVYRLMFSDGFSYGLPPSAASLRITHEALGLFGIERWMLAGLDFDVFALTRDALELGADLRVGLEDAPRGCGQTNLELVKRAVKYSRDAGRDLASPKDIRAAVPNPLPADVASGM
jgi:3-keto-5-aminohexanoate cleavage enzyme